MAVERNPDEARQASKPGTVRYMLALSFVATAVVFVIAYVYFAQ